MTSCKKQIKDIEEKFADLISNEIITIGPNVCPDDFDTELRKERSETWNSDEVFSHEFDLPLKQEHNLPEDPVIYPSHAGKKGRKCHTLKNKIYTLEGKRCRLYCDFYTRPHPENPSGQTPLENSYIEAYVERDGRVDNVSFKLGNHEDMSDERYHPDGEYHFGGYGCSFHQNFAESKVEYVHSDGDTEGQSVEKPLPKSLEPNRVYGYRVECQNIAGKREKIMRMYVDYNGKPENPNWKIVLTRKWTKDTWDRNIDFGGKSGIDLDQVKEGVYKGICHRWWIRLNPSGSSGLLKISKISIGKMDEYQP